MKKSILWISVTFLFFMSNLWAQYPGYNLRVNNNFLPDPFSIKEGVAVFVDFQNATYKIGYDITSKKTYYQATINFTSTLTGYPIFDVVRNPTRVILNGVDVSSRSVVTPGQETTLRVVNKMIYPGEYNLYVEGEITENIEYGEGFIRSGLWFDDHEDRSFLEKYLPTNLEFDQYAMKIQLYIKGQGPGYHHSIYSNGVITDSNQGYLNIDYPSSFNCSAIYLHILPANEVNEVSYVYVSPVTRKEIPITIYGKNASNERLKNAMDLTLSNILQLERTWGMFPKEKLTVFLVPDGKGGVEHDGAVVSEIKNLKHEISHQYLSRGYRPVNGNAGWIDEAIITWFDKQMPQYTGMKNRYALAGQAYYTRKTDLKSYDHGVQFIGYLNYMLQSQGRGGLMRFLSYLAVNKTKERYSTETFIKEMEKYYQIPLEELFRKYVY